ncbi:hypothetical protein ACFQ9V_16565 [Leifsonia sp. NPDC056665]|uniref:hypothetical protein n=1 Tax=Leifsonia sp. NPDC056665 TaxID=3345901 RepID=UPI0036A61FC9
MDMGRCAAAIADAEGWTVLGRRPGDASGEVSLIVAGGELRGQAVLTVAAVVGLTWDGVASSHLPRSLPPPRDRRASRGRVVVRLREHPGGGTLADVLPADRGLTAGEAVTVLVAAARGLSGLHGAGRGGVRLRPADIGLRDDGCPVLTAIDRLRELDQQTMVEDVAAFAELAGVLCGAVTGEQGDAVLAAAIDWRHRSWDDVVAGALGAADATAVREVGSGAPGVLQSRARGDPTADGGVAADGRERPGVRGGRDILGILERALDVLGDRPVARGLAVARDWIAERPKLVAVACSPLVGVAVLLMIPGHDRPG